MIDHQDIPLVDMVFFIVYFESEPSFGAIYYFKYFIAWIVALPRIDDASLRYGHSHDIAIANSSFHNEIMIIYFSAACGFVAAVKNVRLVFAQSHLFVIVMGQKEFIIQRLDDPGIILKKSKIRLFDIYGRCRDPEDKVPVFEVGVLRINKEL